MQNAYTSYEWRDRNGVPNQSLAKPHRAKNRRVTGSIRDFCRYTGLRRAALWRHM